MLPTNRLCRISLVCILLVASLALLASGCLWGKVIDSDTGAPIHGASVSYVDSYGHTGTAVTNSKGLYAFDVAAGPIPAAGPVTLTVGASGYDSVSLPTLVQYSDNPNASPANLSSFWDVQSFVLAPSGTTAPMTDLAVTDLYPDNQPSGTLWARITNNGPDSLASAGIRLSCQATRHSTDLCATGSFEPLTAEGIDTSAPGQTITFNVGMGLDTSKYWYEATCSVQPLKGSYSDPNPVNDFYTEIIPPPTGDLELENILLGMDNQVRIGVRSSGSLSGGFCWTIQSATIGAGACGKPVPSAGQVFETGSYVSGTETVTASIRACLPETNAWNNQLVKTCSAASHSCW
jgi:Carboxypeptidase regulatory-like domain